MAVLNDLLLKKVKALQPTEEEQANHEQAFKIVEKVLHEKWPDAKVCPSLPSYLLSRPESPQMLPKHTGIYPVGMEDQTSRVTSVHLSCAGRISLLHVLRRALEAHCLHLGCCIISRKVTGRCSCLLAPCKT